MLPMTLDLEKSKPDMAFLYTLTCLKLVCNKPIIIISRILLLSTSAAGTERSDHFGG